jgi:hypothetical protein
MHVVCAEAIARMIALNERSGGEESKPSEFAVSSLAMYCQLTTTRLILQGTWKVLIYDAFGLEVLVAVLLDCASSRELCSDFDSALPTWRYPQAGNHAALVINTLCCCLLSRVSRRSALRIRPLHQRRERVPVSQQRTALPAC